MSVAPPLGKELASVDKKTRDAAVKSLRNFLATTAERPLPKLEMTKLWKAIFYCFWLSDKPLVQQELSSSLADLVLVIPSSHESLQFLRGFWETIVREWSALDYLRIDKYYLLVRKFVNASFRLLIRENWDVKAMEEYSSIMSGRGGPLYPEDRKIPTSLGYHLADIYNEELNKAMAANPEAAPVPLVPLFTPFFKLISLSTSLTTYNRFHSSLFNPMFSALLTHSLPADNARNYRSTGDTSTLSSHDSNNQRRKRARIEPPEPPLPAVCRNACLDAGSSQQEGQDESSEPKPLNPKELRKGLLKAMFDTASKEDTKEVSRKRMYRSWKEATELTEDMENKEVVT
ncbi:Nop52-domain-containing protein [Serendipita vermifera]|nr:Nop52-domain-containing protein [Serendipita vermifera]